MRFVFLSYNYSADVSSPQQWIERIDFYVGSQECLAQNNTVIRVDQINYEGEFDHNGVRYFFVNDGKKKNIFPGKLNRFVKNLDPDVVVVASFLFPFQVIQLRRCLGKTVKIMVQNHAERPFTGVKQYMQRLASKHADAFLFASQELGKQWVNAGNIIHEKKIMEIPEVSSSFSREDKASSKEITGMTGAPAFLWVGTLTARKDPLTVIKAFLIYIKTNPAAKLYMIFQENDLLDEVRSLLRDDQVQSIVLVGKINHKDLQPWFCSADFFIAASHSEGSGIALTEAMSCGCVPIVTNIPSFRAITNNGDCGFLYNVQDIDGLSAILKDLPHHDIAEKRKKTLAHFNKELSFEAIAKKFLELARR